MCIQLYIDRRSPRQALKAGSRALLLLLLRFLYDLLKLNDAVKDPKQRNRSVDRYWPAIAEANQFGEKDSLSSAITELHLQICHGLAANKIDTA